MKGANCFCNTSNCITVRPVGGHLTPKMNKAFFIRNLMLNIFLFTNFFEKQLYFKRKLQKNCFGGAFDNFSGKEGVLRRKLRSLFYHKWWIWTFLWEIRSRIFYRLTIFSKKAIFLETTGKKILGEHDHFLERVILRQKWI